ncbi:MAG: hypothetical protein ACK52A_01225, partial [Planctomycetota bacterium]
MSLPPLKLPSPLARPLRTGLLLTLTLWAVHSMERLGAQDRLHGENLLLTRQPDGTVAAAKTPEHW